MSSTNEQFAVLNAKLKEANVVKDEYIGRFLSLCAQYVDKLDNYRKMVNKKMKNKELEELYRITKSTELKEEEIEELNQNFDSVFLHLHAHTRMYAYIIYNLKDMKQEIQNKDLMRRAVRHLLVTDDDVMNEAERIVGHTLQRENQGDNGCLTVTEIARELEMEARDLNSFLRDKGIQKWKQGQYRLTPQYEGLGLTHDRLFIYYSKDGKKKRQTYLVWTPKGLEFIRKLIKG